MNEHEKAARYVDLTIVRAEVEKGGVIVAEVETIGPPAKREATTTKRRSK